MNTNESNFDPLLAKLRFCISDDELKLFASQSESQRLINDFQQDFATWLRIQPEFETCFPDQDAAKIFVEQMSELWNVMFLGRIDDFVIKSRVAFAHMCLTRELPIEFVCVALNYAASFWRLRLSEHCAKTEEQFAHALFKHVLFDFSFVTQIYFSYMQKKNDEIAAETDELIKSVTQVAASLAAGNFSINFKPKTTREEQISDVMNRVLEKFRRAVFQVIALADGDYSNEIYGADAQDELSKALAQLLTSLRQSNETSHHEAWIKDGHTGLSQLMRGDLTLSALATNIVGFLAKYTGALIGALYCVDRERRTILRCYGSFADIVDERNREIRLGHGLIGQTALEKEEMVLTDIPDKYISINSSLGSSRPQAIVLFPFLFEGEVYGVVELGYSQDIANRALQLLRTVSESIAIAIKSGQDAERIKSLLSANQSREIRAC